MRNFYFVVLLLFINCKLLLAQIAPVKGKVIDQTGLPLPGVTVKANGTTNATVTDLSGKFSIVPALKGTLTFTFIGFSAQTVTVGKQSVVNITMAATANNLNEVVVVGYGTRQKRDVTGAISSVKAKQLENENPASVSDLLKGNVPGITVGMNTSAKGGGNGDLLVRGKTTLSANTAPLIVLDGVIYQGQQTLTQMILKLLMF